MSVLASKRQISKHEYAEQFMKLYEYTEVKLSKMAKRKYRWLAEPIVAKMNLMRDEIMQIFDAYYDDGKSRKERSAKVIRDLLSLQKHLLALWNVEGYKTDRMIRWASMIDREIVLLAGYGGFRTAGRYMYILDREAVNRLECLKSMSALHKMIYSKMISLPATPRSTKGSYLMSMADEALYRISEGNRIFPKTKEEYELREKNFSRALNCLKSMESPLMAVFNLMDYSDETMEEMAGLVTETAKLLRGLMESDRKRFNNLG